MGYTRIVYLEHAGANLAAHIAGITIAQPVQPFADKIRQHPLTRCIQLGPYHTVTLHTHHNLLDIII